MVGDRGFVNFLGLLVLLDGRIELMSVGRGEDGTADETENPGHSSGNYHNYPF